MFLMRNRYVDLGGQYRGAKQQEYDLFFSQYTATVFMVRWRVFRDFIVLVENYSSPTYCEQMCGLFFLHLFEQGNA